MSYSLKDNNVVFKATSWTLISIGIFLRLAHYFSNRSLWFDEALISLNIINRNIWGLLGHLDYNQGAPAGFLIVEKLLTTLFGKSDYVLRLFPLICGISSLFIFYRLAKIYLNRIGALTALALFAISEPLIYYSSEVKVYSGDVTATTLLLLIAFSIEQKNKISFLQIALFSFFGVLLFGFSIPSAFVFGSMAIGFLLKSILDKNWKLVKDILLCSSFWLLGAFLIYKVYLSGLAAERIRLSLFPLTFQWFYDLFVRLFESLQLYEFGIPQILFLIGLVSALKRKNILFFIFVFTICFMTLAFSINLYPVKNRFILFISPIVFLLVAEGITIILKRLSTNLSLSLVAIVLLFWNPVSSAIYHVVNPQTVQEIKPILRYIKEHSRKDDILYVYPNAQYAFKFYAKQFGFNDDFKIDKSIFYADLKLNRWIEKKGYLTIALGINNEDFTENLDRLKGYKRVWVLLSEVIKEEHEAFVVNHLNSIGTRLANFSRSGTKVYLYDLSNGRKQIQ